MRTYVVIVSSQSLFAEGVANRLQQYLKESMFKVVNPQQPDALAEIIVARPSIVILDLADPETSQICSLSSLLSSLPELKILRLDPQHDKVQVVTSEQRSVVEVRDLVDAIKLTP